MGFIKALVVLISISNAISDPLDSKDVGIIGGHNIAIEQVPYIVSLRLDGTLFWCGGSIIHERFILTAAHCIVPKRKYKVLVGTDKVDEGGELYEVENIFVHDKYSNKTFDYDICVLKLKETLTFGPKVNKIELTSHDAVNFKRGMMLNATGWGYTKPGGKISKALRQVSIPFISRRACQTSYDKKWEITRRMFCAGGHGRDACSGDSGGPLIWNNVQVGVTSFGAGCGVLPGVYSKVANLYYWIMKTIADNF